MKRLRLITTALALILLGWLVIYLIQTREPSYQGRKLSAWLIDYDQAGWNNDKFPAGVKVRQNAEHAVKAIGTNAIPTLLKWLPAKDGPMKIKLNTWLTAQKRIHFRFQTAQVLQVMALDGFEILGPDGLSAVPTLNRFLNSGDAGLRLTALQCLVRINHGNKVPLPEILHAIHSDDNQVRQTAAAYLVFNYPAAAGPAGVYKLFPVYENLTANTRQTNSPPPDK